MAYTPLKISVPTPCHEDWNGMTPVSGTTARHCDSCAKNVTDFTGFTDDQLHAYARENKGRMCGRFRPDQLERPLRAISDRRASPLKVAAATAGLLLSSAAMEAQSALPTPESLAKVETKDATLANILAINAAHLSTDADATTIRGEMTAKPVTADSLPPRPPVVGKIAIHPRIEDEIVGDIVVEPIPDTIPGGEIICPIPDTIPLPEEQHPMIMGIMIMEVPEPTGMDWVKDTIKQMLPQLPLPPKEPTSHPRPRPEATYLESLVVSPNPFDRELRLDLNVPKDGSLVIELLNANGQLVHSQLWHVVAGDNFLNLAPKRRKTSPGIYYLRITDFNELEVVRTVVKR